MMEPYEVTVAREFHETYERLAPEHGFEKTPDSLTKWEELPERDRTFLIAVITDLLGRHILR